ncbi:MAG: tetratricopeptide repeat protein [Methanomicrobiales archaeon]|nr:tetratricopeptide repeat protein [Methanomicrobiales archaeon]
MQQFLTILALVTMAAICIQPVSAGDDEATTYYNIGQQAIANGAYEKALEYFDKVLASNTTLLGMGDGLMYTYKDKSGVLTELGRYDDALKTANDGIVLYPKSAGLWNNKGYALYKMGKYSDAADAYTKSVELDPTYIKGWINKGNALVKAGRSSDAVAAYSKALELDPRNTDATAGLADAKKSADSTLIFYGLIAVIAIGAIILFVRVRNGKEEAKPAGKGKEKK